MASSGQRCPLCNDSLMKYLVNPDEDYILSCSSSACLYGVLYAEIYRSNGERVTSSASTIDGGSGASVEPSSTFSDEYENNRVQGSELAAEPPDVFPMSLNIPSSDSDDNMINNWVEELMQQSTEVNAQLAVSSSQSSSSHTVSTSSVPLPPPSPSVAAEAGSVQPVLPTSPELPTDLVSWSQSTSSTARPTVTMKATTRTGAGAAGRKVRQQPVRNLTKAPQTRGARPLLTTSLAKLPEKKGTEKSAKSECSVARPRKLAARLQKTQALASALKTHLGSNDDVPSEASSDSGIQSDASSDRSCSSSLTPIQRLLHIEEAKKRSWGVTGLSGYKPLASRSRSNEAFC